VANVAASISCVFSTSRTETLVLDEPTNHLDKAAKRWLFDELEQFRGTVLVISHDLPLSGQALLIECWLCATGSCASTKATTPSSSDSKKSVA
jgi:ATPase subunit of ABC transporter with duplicated ATPase domains